MRTLVEMGGACVFLAVQKRERSGCLLVRAKVEGYSRPVKELAFAMILQGEVGSMFVVYLCP